MEKRVIIATVLSALVLLAFSYFFQSPLAPKREPEKRIAEEKPLEAKKAAPSEEKALAIKAKQLPLPSEKEIVVETDLYKAILTNRGGAIKSWELKRYTGNGKGHVQLIPQTEGIIYPLSLEIEGADINDKIFAADKNNITLSKDKNKDIITLSYADSKGIKAEKKLTFYNDTYKIDIDLSAEGIDKPLFFSIGSDFGIVDKTATGYGSHIGAVASIDKKLKFDLPKKAGDTVQHQGKIAWAASEDKYFIASIIPKNTINEVIVRKEEKDRFNTLIKFPKADKLKETLVLYAGPKEYSRLEAFRIGLEETIPLGWFWFIGLPLFQLMKWLYKILGNYGIAIILITVIIKIIFAPLTHKSYKSMKAMQKLQPKIAALQEKFKNDKQKLNVEMMNLYKTHKANPVSGCLPMVIQIPVFIALYNVLSYAIELRHAPFFWWIQDLAAMDPYYILPIIMGISMLIQQWMTPAAPTADPIQSKMMYAMPVIFTFMFLNFPSGLVLYWLVNNVLSIAQQAITNKYLTSPATTEAS
ncbi:MAG: membrane protein insertase YidC [Nitrospirae bacterium]|nr:membrane protein insertase YidC [Nitrospirota bacterium]